MADNIVDTLEKGATLTQSSPSQSFPLPIPFDQSVNRSVAASLWRQENMFGSFFRNQNLKNQVSQFEKDPEFDYFDNVPSDLFDHRDRFVATQSMEELNAVAAQIRQEIEDKTNLAGHPIQSLALGFFVANADPTILLPGGTFYKTTKTGLRAAKSALSLGIATGLQATAQEFALNSTQQVRSLEESAFNVLSSALLGSVVGGVGGAVMGGQVGKTAKAHINETYNHGVGAPKDADLSAAKVDPEYARQSDKLSGFAGVVQFVGKALTPMTRLMDSPFQTARAFADLTYEHNIIKNKNLPEMGNVAKPRDVETKIRLKFGETEKALADYQDVFFRQAGIESGPLKTLRGVISKQGLGFADFDSQVGIALRNDGKSGNPAVAEAAKILREKVFDPLKEEAIELGLLPKNVNVKTALSYFTRVFDRQRIKENPDAFKAAIRPWLIAKNDELKAFQPTVESFRKRMTKARADITRAKNASRKIKGLEKKKTLTDIEKRRLRELKKSLGVEDAEAILKNLEKELDESIAFDLKDHNGNIRKILDEEQIETTADQIMANVLGRSEQKLRNPILAKFAGSGKSKPLHNRHFLIPDELIEGFTINSASRVAEHYSRGMVPTLELYKFARRVDTPVKRSKKIDALLLKRDEIEVRLAQMTEAEKMSAMVDIADINAQIKELEGVPTPEEAMGQFRVDLENDLNIMKQGKDAKEAAKLEEAFSKNLRDMEATFELLQGVYGVGPNIIDGTTAAKAARSLKNWNFTRLLGFMTISSLPDVGMHVMRHGPMQFMRSGVLDLLKRMETTKLNKEFLQDMGLAIEALRGQRLKSFMDHEGTALETGLFGKGLEFITNTFGNATLMNQWQDMNHLIAGNMGISRTLRAIDKWARTGKMSRKDRVRFNSLSLEESHWRTIHKEWKRTGTKEGSSYSSDWGSWNLEDKPVSDAYAAFRESIYREVNQTLIMPGLGDKPLFSQGQVGSILFQFKSFIFAANNKVLTAGLSRNDAEFYMGVCTMLTLGAMGYFITSKLRNPEEEVDMSWEKLAKEAVDRSGVLGVFMEGFNMADKLLGNNGVSRYHSRGVTGAFFGPTVGLAEDIAFIINRISRSIGDGDDAIDLTTKDAEKLMRLAPYQNLFYLFYLNRVVTKKAALGLNFED